jgi:hypothetical protein
MPGRAWAGPGPGIQVLGMSGQLGTVRSSHVLEKRYCRPHAVQRAALAWVGGRGGQAQVEAGSGEGGVKGKCSRRGGGGRAVRL